MTYRLAIRRNVYHPDRIEKDFMHNLLDMGAPSSILWHAEKGECDIGSRCTPAVATLVYPHDTIELCEKHEKLRKAGKVK